MSDFSLALHTSAPLSASPAAAYLASLAPGSRRTMRESLNAIARLVSSGVYDAFSFPWQDLRYQHLTAIRTALAERYAPATANKMLAALKRTLKECTRLGLMSAEDYAKATDIAPVKGSRALKGRALQGSEIQKLMNVCIADTSPAGKRDAAMIIVLCCGLRRSEVVKLDISDIDLDSGEILIREGKGKKDRTTYLPESDIQYLIDWLNIRTKLVTPALLVPISRTGNLIDRRLSDQSVLYCLNQRAQQAGVADFSPHDWRRTYIGDLLDAGVDTITVQKMVGHSDPKTTSKYDRRGERAKKEAANRLKRF